MRDIERFNKFKDIRNQGVNKFYALLHGYGDSIGLIYITLGKKSIQKIPKLEVLRSFQRFSI